MPEPQRSTHGHRPLLTDRVRPTSHNTSTISRFLEWAYVLPISTRSSTMEIQTMYAQPVPFNQWHGSFFSHPPSLSSPYHDRIGGDAPVIRTTSLPASMPAGPLHRSIEPVFSIHSTKIQWKRLPTSVLSLMLQHLRGIHLTAKSTCSTCYLRDLTSVQLTCKAWFSDAQRIL